MCWPFAARVLDDALLLYEREMVTIVVLINISCS